MKSTQPNGDRVTLAVLGQKVDSLAGEVSAMRTEHDAHVAAGQDVLQRLTAAESAVALLTKCQAAILELTTLAARTDTKVSMLMWAVPLTFTAVGVVIAIIRFAGDLG